MTSYRRRNGLVDRTFRGTTELLEGDDTAIRLEGVASIVWTITDRSATRAEIEAELDRQAGTEVDRVMVQEALDQMLACGALVAMRSAE